MVSWLVCFYFFDRKLTFFFFFLGVYLWETNSTRDTYVVPKQSLLIIEKMVYNYFGHLKRTVYIEFSVCSLLIVVNIKVYLGKISQL